VRWQAKRDTALDFAVSYIELPIEHEITTPHSKRCRAALATALQKLVDPSIQTDQPDVDLQLLNDSGYTHFTVYKSATIFVQWS
jgi:hypothetical protein